jgi:hypothetical protein
VLIGITGHMNLTPESVPLVAAELEKVLGDFAAPLVGVSCLARGSDQLFARAVLGLGGGLEVILPAADYREHVVEPDNLDEFDSLLRRAGTVRVLPFERSHRDAYAAAGEHVLSGVDLLLAVWDGAPPDGKGGTGDTVRTARTRGVPVKVIWPNGATRTLEP